MNKVSPSKLAALESIRKQLGRQVTSASALLEAREGFPEEQADGTPAPETAGHGLASVETPRRWGPLDEELPRGQLTEIVEGGGGGAGLVLADLLARARRRRQYVLLLDVGCGFDPGSFPEADLESLLWVGCSSAGEAMEALDVAARDENFDLYLVDLRNCDSGEWRSLRPRQWYRVLGRMRTRGASAVLFAGEAVTSVSKRKIAVDLAMSCRDLERERPVLRAAVEAELVRGEQGGRETREASRMAG